ncbi:MAG: CRISPR-associated endonuclease Cas2 [Caldilineaceae bacterium]|nr:CRISPR-associated endonuclease Cas2 [Caldilineaceae bacterium]MCB0097400.1 CRISPR-associated endonuclease Cas2 [Caldilineaceae bacterium]MCB0144953.1 CRISPR-associated endonuclease Cas2 [Caldilineaceae bacterium]MCB9148514.1 CRISPR-associated endonuclease Cas2 [Caldilineaceae bacterium]
MAGDRNTTFYIIAYDIGSNKRRTKVHKILSSFGHWTQYSLFECFLSEKQYLLLRSRLEKHLNQNVDSVRFYALCGACRGRVETVGQPPRAEPELFVI